jgi:hypothetical protein
MMATCYSGVHWLCFRTPLEMDKTPLMAPAGHATGGVGHAKSWFHRAGYGISAGQPRYGCTVHSHYGNVRKTFEAAGRCSSKMYAWLLIQLQHRTSKQLIAERGYACWLGRNNISRQQLLHQYQ